MSEEVLISFEVNYGAVIPPAYVIEYYGSKFCSKSGSQRMFQAVLSCFTKPFLPIRNASNFARSLTAIC